MLFKLSVISRNEKIKNYIAQSSFLVNAPILCKHMLQRLKYLKSLLMIIMKRHHTCTNKIGTREAKISCQILYIILP